MTHEQLIFAADSRLRTCLNAYRATEILTVLANYKEAHQMSLDLNQVQEERNKWTALRSLWQGKLERLI